MAKTRSIAVKSKTTKKKDNDLKKTVSRLIAKSIETKRRYVAADRLILSDSDLAINTEAYINNVLADVNNGNSSETRVGSKIFANHINIKGFLSIANGTTQPDKASYVRIIVGMTHGQRGSSDITKNTQLWKYPNGADADYNELRDNFPPSILNFTSHRHIHLALNKRDFIPLADQVVKVGGGDDPPTKAFNVSRNINKEIHFANQLEGAQSQDHRIFMMMVVYTPGTNKPLDSVTDILFDFMSILSYKDA